MLSDRKTCIGWILFGYPALAFLVVPIHFRLQLPRESSAIDAFVTWMVSGVLAFAGRSLFP